MNANQLKNLIEFTTIFLSGDLNLRMESSDYYMEKYNKYIGIPLEKSDITTNTYKEWEKIWGENDNVNNIINYFLSIIKKSKNSNNNKHFLINLTISDLLESFREFIGDPNNINLNRYSYIHPVVKNIFVDFIRKNSRYIKFLNILDV